MPARSQKEDDPEIRGGCSCGWRGPWRTTDTDAKLDAQKHCAEEGCSPRNVQIPPPQAGHLPDDLMPHERR